MEPRPLKPPQRQPTPTPPPASALPPVDRGNWTPPQAKASAGYPSPVLPPAPTYAGPMTDPAAARGAWYDPAAAPLPVIDPALKPGYSPGPALTPIDGGRGARILGPLLALVVLAAVVGAVVFVALRVFGGDDGRDNTLAAANITATSVAAQAAAGTAVATQPPGQTAPTVAGGNSAVAGAEETAQPVPTNAAGATGQTPAAGETPAEVEPTPIPTRQITSARSLLPSTSDLPAGFERTDDAKRTEDEVAGSLSNTSAEDAKALLESWGWQENAYRNFEIPAGSSPDPISTTAISVSVHRFDSKKGASNALTLFSDDIKASQGMEEIEVEKIGDRMVALKGTSDGATLVVLYIRTGNYLIRIGGTSPQGDPTQDVVNVAKTIVNG